MLHLLAHFSRDAVLKEPVRGGISELCKMLGIKLSSRLTRNKTTHLICGEDGAHSEKRINAEAWGSVLLVTPDWLLQSVCHGQRQAEDAFPVGTAVAAPLQLAFGPEEDHAPVQHVLPVRPVAQASPPAAAAPSIDAGQAVVSELPSTRPRTSDDHPVDMLDVVARLTSAARQTGKRRARTTLALLRGQLADWPGVQAHKLRWRARLWRQRRLAESLCCRARRASRYRFTDAGSGMHRAQSKLISLLARLPWAQTSTEEAHRCCRCVLRVRDISVTYVTRTMPRAAHGVRLASRGVAAAAGVRRRSWCPQKRQHNR